MTNGGAEPEPTTDELEVAWRAYGEVLDATKHQDDKIGRFLTGIAFLTTGAIAFGARSEFLAVRYDLAGAMLNLPAIFFVAFLLLVIVTVLLLLLALGPNLELPRWPARQVRGDSRIFFLAISDWRRSEWVGRWSHEYGAERRQLYDGLPWEVHNLATKVDFKYGRTSEARAAFSLALLSLALAFVLGVNALTAVRPAGPGAAADFSVTDGVAWVLRPRLLAAGVLAGGAFFFAYDYFRLEQTLDNRFDPDLRRRLWWLYALMACAPVYALTLVVDPFDAPWANVALQLAALVPMALLGWTRWKQSRLRFVAVAGLGVVAVGGAVATALEDPASQLLVACVAVALLELPRMLNATRQWVKRKRAYQGSAVPEAGVAVVSPAGDA